MKCAIPTFLTLIFVLSGISKKGFGSGNQDYGYATVRKGSHMFWWLYHTTASVDNSADRPLIMWLTGGPGVSSTGIGNFLTAGPLDENLNPREYTWVKEYNLLFVDNPVGTGYSYVENGTLLPTSNVEIARDLVEFLKQFYNELPQFKTTPLYIYGESYGGKMAVDFVKLLVDEVTSGKIQSNIKGVAMGNAFIHPVYTLLSIGPFLYHLGLVDKDGATAIVNPATKCKQAVDEDRMVDSRALFYETLQAVTAQTDGIDMYDVRTKVTKEMKELASDTLTDPEKLTHLMNGPVKEALGIPSSIVWNYTNDDLYHNVIHEFMKPVTSTIEHLLNETSVKVFVCNGNLDWFANAPAQLRWIEELRWPRRSEYLDAPRRSIWVNDTMEGYEKTGGKFTFFWINGAGHSGPKDNPAAFTAFLKSMTGV